MDAVIRWGILGTGHIAQAFATALHQTPGALLAGVGSRTAASSAAFGARFGVAAYASYADLVKAADIDIVYIGTPHTEHAAHALLALGAGKAVLCEKPFAMNAREARQVIAAAQARGLFVMEAMWTRFLPALAELQRCIGAGAIGTPALLHADFGFAASRDSAHRVNCRELGGGALLDLGIYPLSIASAILGPVLATQAQAVLSPAGVDLSTVFTLRHASGALSTCSCSLRARTPNTLSVSGEGGSIRLDHMFHAAPSVTLTRADGSMQTLATPYLGNGYVHEALAAGAALRAGFTESALMTHAETLMLMQQLDDIRRQIGVRYPADETV